MSHYYVNLPPLDKLTVDQQSALNEPNQIALSGGPGTGKSTVSIYRHIANYQANPIRPSLLLTYTTTLKRYIQACCRIKNKDASTRVGSSLRNRNLTTNGRFYEVIIDEAQDLPSEYFKEIISPVSYGADDAQILFPDHSTSTNDLRQLFPQNYSYVLQKNKRCSRKIMEFARIAFPDAIIPEREIEEIERIGVEPSLYIGYWDSRIETILKIISDYSDETQNIAILVHSRQRVRRYVNILDENGVNDFSFYYSNMRDFPDGCPPIKNLHITTFKSAKGLEFDTVIIPDFNRLYELDDNEIVTWKDFYVGCTRTKSNLFILSNRDIRFAEDVVEKTFL